MRFRNERDFLESYQTILVLKHAVADTEFYVELARDMVEAESDRRIADSPRKTCHVAWSLQSLALCGVPGERPFEA
jgi:hypothetical protein